MSATTHVLVVEDNPADVDAIRDGLADVPFGHFELESADRLATALRLLGAKRAVDVVLLDLGLPDSTGLDTLLNVKRRRPFRWWS
jgi:DNA-binding response OmpR family regulator